VSAERAGGLAPGRSGRSEGRRRKGASRQRLTCVVVFGLFATALALRLFRIGSPDLWLDEAYSGVVSLADRAEFFTLLRTDTAPPLYYLVLRVWTAVFGHSEAGLRSLSAVAGALTAALAYLVARRASEAAGIAAGILLALTPLHVHYSQEARTYGLLLLLLLGAIACLLRAVDAGGPARRRWWAAYAALGAAALWMHTFAAFALAAAPVAALRRGPRAALEAALATLAAGLTILPLLPQSIAQSRTAEADWMGDVFRSIPPALAIPRTLEVFTPGALFPPYAQFRFGAPLWRPAVFILCAAVLISGVWVALRDMGGRDSRRADLGGRGSCRAVAWTGLAFLFVPLLLLWAVSFVKPLYVLARYDIVALPGFALLVGAGVAALPRSGRALVALLAIVLAAGSLSKHYARDPAEVSLPRAIREKLVPALRDGDVLLFTGFSTTEVRYGLLRAGMDPAFFTVPPSTKSHPGWLDVRALTDPATLLADASRAARDAEATAGPGRVWVIVDPRAPGPQQAVDALQAEGWRAARIVDLLPETPPRWGAPLRAIEFGRP